MLIPLTLPILYYLFFGNSASFKGFFPFFPLGDGFQTIQSLYAIGSGGLLGLGLGKLLHWYVMSQIHVDAMAFADRISVWSYLISFGMTVVFAVLANLFMQIRLERVPMAITTVSQG